MSNKKRDIFRRILRFFTSSIGYHGFYVTTDGIVHGFGKNISCQLGVGHDETKNEGPEEVTFFTLNKIDITNISVGKDHSVFTSRRNKLYACGSFTRDELFTPSDLVKLQVGEDIIGAGVCKPMQPKESKNWKVSTSGGGDRFSYAITIEGLVYGAGSNKCSCLLPGQLEAVYKSPLMIKFRKPITEVKCGYDHSLFMARDHSIYFMGQNTKGQCGFGKEVEYVSSENYQLDLPLISKLRIKKFSTGYHHTHFLTEKGTIFACGSGEFGRLGDEKDAPRMTPIKVPMAGKVKNILSGGDTSFFLLRSGDILGCGYNGNGELADGEIYHVYEPTHLPHIRKPSDDCGEIIQVCAGIGSLFVIEKVGVDTHNIWGAGTNSQGALCNFNSSKSKLFGANRFHSLQIIVKGVKLKESLRDYRINIERRERLDFLIERFSLMELINL